jgi:hypothetical protein
VNHPLTFIHKWNRKPVFIVLLVWSLVLFGVLQILNAPLITAVAPLGIVSHQFAWTTQKAQAILASWAGRPDLFAALGLGLDYLFIPTYAFMLGLGALLAAGRHLNLAIWLRKLGIYATYGVFIGAAFDILENVLQARQLLDGVITSPLVFFTGVCASLKFGLMGLGILYILVGWLLPKYR